MAILLALQGTTMGVTRHGIAKNQGTTLQQASYESPSSVFFDAARRGRSDFISGASSSVIVGAPIPMGTNSFKVVQDPHDGMPVTRPPSFLGTLK